jgi:hypothetical protein
VKLGKSHTHMPERDLSVRRQKRFSREEKLKATLMSDNKAWKVFCPPQPIRIWAIQLLAMVIAAINLAITRLGSLARKKICGGERCESIVAFLPVISADDAAAAAGYVVVPRSSESRAKCQPT